MQPPFFAYLHSAKVVPNEACPTGSSAVGGVAFQAYSGGSYPARYNGALFFADYSRKCIWAMLNGSNGLPNPATIENFTVAAANPVDLKIAPNGELFYVDLNGGTIRRIQYTGPGNQPPTARISATPTSGAVPLTVSFNGSASSDPDPGDTLTYAWDLNADGLFDNGNGVTASFTYTQPGTYTARLRVTDSKGASSTASTTITAGSSSTPPIDPVVDVVNADRQTIGKLLHSEFFRAHQADG